MWDTLRYNESINALSRSNKPCRCTGCSWRVAADCELASASLSLSTFFLAQAPALSAQMRAHKRCKQLCALKRRFGKIRLEKHSMFQFCAARSFRRPTRESESVKLPVTSCLFEFASWRSIAISTWFAGWKTSDQKWLRIFFFFFFILFGIHLVCN